MIVVVVVDDHLLAMQPGNIVILGIYLQETATLSIWQSYSFFHSNILKMAGKTLVKHLSRAFPFIPASSRYV